MAARLPEEFRSYMCRSGYAPMEITRLLVMTDMILDKYTLEYDLSTLELSIKEHQLAMDNLASRTLLTFRAILAHIQSVNFANTSEDLCLTGTEFTLCGGWQEIADEEPDRTWSFARQVYYVQHDMAKRLQYPNDALTEADAKMANLSC